MLIAVAVLGVAIAAAVTFRLSRRDQVVLVGPPITADELDELAAWHQSIERPIAQISIAPEAALDPQQSHLGGQPWVGSDFVWPQDNEGTPLLFVAQINLAELPTLPDFPDSGIMLFFVAQHHSFGMGRYADPVGDTRVVFFPHAVAMTGGPAALPYTVGRKPIAPFRDVGVMVAGRAIHFTPGSVRPSLADWRMWERLETFSGRIGQGAFDERVEQLNDAAPPFYIGGFAQFVQEDPRVPVKEWRPYDVPLLKLGFDDTLMFGDGGEANFLIAQEALSSSAFERYLFTWDCS